jgi:predicted Zn finger-like uncharacterized protein
MKIICDSCGTKYSISDDKVRGKVFKIRCKKCSHIVVVRGNEGAEAASAAPAVEGGWHIVVDGEQVGPIAESDVRARIERGEVRADTYIWKEGFADWLKLSAVPEFADAVGAESAPLSVSVDPFAAAPAANGAERKQRPSGARGSLFGGGGGGLAAAGTEDVFSAPAASSRGADLFAASAAAPASAEPRWPSSGAPAAGHDGGRVENLTGQRHENSVLFSLSNLQSLAMNSPAAAKPAPTSMGAPAAEGSGLIDIRAMAASTFSAPSSGGAIGGGGSPADDLPAFGGFSPAAPVLLPLQTGGPPKWIWLVVLGMLGLVGVVLFFGWKIFTAKSPLEPTQVVVQVPVPTPVPTPPPAAGTKGAEDKPRISDDQLPPRDGDKAESKSEKSEKSDKGHRSSKSKGDKGDKGERKSSGGDDKKAVADKAATPAPDTGPKPAKGSIDDLLLGATGGSKKTGGGGGKEEKKEAAAEPGSAGPLAKSAVVGGMNAIKPKIQDCYNQFKVPGMAMVNVVIARSGKVTSATVTGKFAGTPTGACVEKAVKAASFPPSDGLTTPYPFQLR